MGSPKVLTGPQRREYMAVALLSRGWVVKSHSRQHSLAIRPDRPEALYSLSAAYVEEFGTLDVPPRPEPRPETT